MTALQVATSRLDKVALYIIVILFSYLVGAVHIQIMWRVLDILGGWLDGITSQVPKGGRWHRFFQYCSDRLHVFSVRTLDTEVGVQFASMGEPQDKEEYSGPYWASKMVILDRSPALAREAMEIEGDINFHAGMFTPMILLGIYLAGQSAAASVGCILIAVFFFLRFQHLRHDDVAFIARAAKSLRKS
ncbi:MAG: hypothetical protein U0487_01455 [Patescibacteria group bacterium]